MDRLRAVSAPTRAANAAELLIDAARRARAMLRRGAATDDARGRLRCSPDACRLALRFFNAGESLKLRALVEDWSYRRILHELQQNRRLVTDAHRT
jgi:hypothetical protein